MLPSIDTAFDGLEYDFEQCGYISTLNPTLAERALWCAVIEQAFVDIGMITDPRGLQKNMMAVSNHRHHDESLRWLLRDKEDFDMVCLLAGVSAAVVRRAAILFTLGNS